ncbi:MAG: NAD(P)H-binding protein, partial [Flavobacteriales bacterium]|nr:NAD(P)H-binding protein [Flavobacteriales bacterium]
MKILLTGATGYIGQRLLPVLIEQGHHVVCCTRDLHRFQAPESLRSQISVIEVDFLKEETLDSIPSDIDAAYFLMHSMSSSQDYQEMELRMAKNFKKSIQATDCEQVIYLSGIVNDDSLSPHLASRKAVEDELSAGDFHLTTLRAAIIIGSGSASFEIIRDLVEKLPIMIAPRWLETRCQPIGIRDVISFLTRVLGHRAAYDGHFDIAGPDVLTYKEMLLGYAQARGLKRYIISVPVMTPRLSSYWLYFVTSTSYKLAMSLVDSMKVEVIAKTNDLAEELGIEPMSYADALELTLQKIEQNQVLSSWKDSRISGRFRLEPSEFLQVPDYGCLKDHRSMQMQDVNKTKDKLWRIGGRTGWYYADGLWRIRGFVDKLFGGVG